MTAQEAELQHCRPRLVQFFLAHRCFGMAEDLASETTVRVLEKIRAGTVIESVGAYTLGVGRLVLLEQFRNQSIKLEEIDPERFAQPATDERAERLSQCLERCIRALPPEKRELIRAVYGDAQARESRAQLASRLGVTPNALDIRAHRIRKESLKPCIERCLDAQGL